MITAITYQSQFSRKFDNKRIKYANPNCTTEELEAMLKRDAEVTHSVYLLVAELNKYMEQSNNATENDEVERPTVAELFKNYFGEWPRMTQVTKKRRRYSMYGLTVHEETI